MHFPDLNAYSTYHISDADGIILSGHATLAASPTRYVAAYNAWNTPNRALERLPSYNLRSTTQGTPVAIGNLFPSTTTQAFSMEIDASSIHVRDD